MTDWAYQATSDGLKLLVSKGLIELTGEHLVVKYADRFPPAAVRAAQAKIDILQSHIRRLAEQQS